MGIAWPPHTDYRRQRGVWLRPGASLPAAGSERHAFARSGDKVEQAVSELSSHAADGATIAGMPADVSRLADMERLVAATLERFGGLDVLMANAGVYGPKGPIETIDWDDWACAVEINLNGTVLSCRAVLPHFKAQRAGKIVVMSGGGATRPMPFFSAYAATKAAVVRFVETLAGEVAEFGIDCNSVAPERSIHACWTRCCGLGQKWWDERSTRLPPSKRRWAATRWNKAQRYASS